MFGPSVNDQAHIDGKPKHGLQSRNAQRYFLVTFKASTEASTALASCTHIAKYRHVSGADYPLPSSSAPLVHARLRVLLNWIGNHTF